MFPCLIKIGRKGEAPEALLTHTENISVGGAGVIVKRHLEIFMPVSVDIDLLDGDDVVTCNGRVVWTVRRKATEEQKPSFYDTGVEFTDLKDLDRARLETMIARLVSAHKPVSEE